MFTADGMRKLHSWTHASLSLLLKHISALPPDAPKIELAGFGYNTVQEQVIHIFNCEGFWISILKGLSYVNRDPADLSGVDDILRFQRETSVRTLEYLATLTDEQLNAVAELNFSDGDRAFRTPALVLHHVLTHAFHHKGQIVAMCRTLGYPAPDTDLNQFE